MSDRRNLVSVRETHLKNAFCGWRHKQLVEFRVLLEPVREVNTAEIPFAFGVSPPH